MNFIKRNIFDFILIVGIVFVSIGCFIYSATTGFIVAGSLLIALSIYAGGGD